MIALRRRRLPAAGFADEPQRLPRLDREAHAIDSPDKPVLRLEDIAAAEGEMDIEVAHFQQRLARSRQRLIGGRIRFGDGGGHAEYSVK